MNRAQIALGSVAGAVAIHAALVTCNRLPGGDAGALLDAETRDANAQAATTLDAPCVRTTTDAGATYYLATFDVPGLDPAHAGEISARACGFVCTTASCSADGRILGVQNATCVSNGFYLGPGRITSVCGTDAEHTQTVRVWIH